MFVDMYSDPRTAYTAPGRAPRAGTGVFACMVTGERAQIQVQEGQEEEQQVRPARLPLGSGEGRRD
jgi:hypothetical protein